jgi:hypothetical protein
MPVFYERTDGSGFYAKACIQGAIVTFHLTGRGAEAGLGGGVGAELNCGGGSVVWTVRALPLARRFPPY